MSDNKKQGKAARWYERILDALESADFAEGSGIDPRIEPEWVVNVLKQLVQQTMPTVSLKPHELSPRRLGRLLGQQQANWAATDKALEASQTPEMLAQIQPMLDRWEKNANHPAVVSLFEAIEFGANSLVAAESIKKRFTEITLDALKTAWEQDDQLERLAFFQGLVEGLAKPGFPSRATDATPIYNRLFIHRKKIQEFKSVRELREFLLQCGLSGQVLGGPKRLEKICERIGLSFAEPGRPKSAK
jgi:hypothetical protein